MKITDPKDGHPIKIGKRPLDFSIWPVRHGQGGWVTSTRLFVAEPWGIIRDIVQSECPKLSKPAALAFVEQSHDYYRAAATASVTAARPVLLYYCFLNLVKSLILTRKIQSSLDIAKHGLSEGIMSGKPELIGAYLEAYPSNKSVNVFDCFLATIRGVGLAGKIRYDVPMLLRQIVTGHRLFISASKGCKESFLSIRHLHMLHDKKGHLWLKIGVVNEDLHRLGVNQTTLLKRCRLESGWQYVSGQPDVKDGMICLEQINTIEYSIGWLPNAVPELINSIRPYIWQIVLSSPPYRAYYLYLPPLIEQNYILPQLLSAYAILYYFGSITRYRPHRFDQILNSSYGPYVESFLHDQPSQMLFLMASEFAKREVTKAAIV
jgi:hypothetical protein